MPRMLSILAVALLSHGVAQPRGVELANLTWVQAEQVLSRDRIVVIPLGAASKEHGPHLRLDNDFQIAEYFKRRVLASSDVVVAPTITYHFYPAFLEYPGSTHLRQETARDLVVDVINSLGQSQAPPAKPWEPTLGMAGKDVVWVPTSPDMVEKMLEVAKVTAADVVMDLGSGDGRMVIGAARRGATAIGVEYTPEMVEHARKNARAAGVEGKATFIQGDMYVADISKATVMALFLLPDNLDKLKDKFLALEPGSRVVLNTYAITGWEPDEHYKVEGGECRSWCEVLLHYVPAQVAGTWRFGNGEFRLTQEFQMVAGVYAIGGTTTPVQGRLKGAEMTMKIGDVDYTGTVSGDSIRGTSGPNRQAWQATRIRK